MRETTRVNVVRRLRSGLLVAVVLGSWASVASAPVQAQENGGPTDSAATAPAPSAESGGEQSRSEGSSDASQTPSSFFEILHSAGIIGYVIIGLSVAALALAIDLALALRRSRLLPDDLAEGVRTLVQQGELAKAQERCRARPCLLAEVIRAGLAEADEGWPACERAMEETLADAGAGLLRRIEYLAVIGNLAPMLGLLGTVVGMVFAFREVALSEGTARAADLAEGIYLALVTTVEGLVVAIPALGAYAVLRNRSDGLLAELARAAEGALRPVRRAAGRGASVDPFPGGRP